MVEDVLYVRTEQDVDAVIRHAKLQRSDLQPVAQILYCADDFPAYKLLEVEPTLLAYLADGGELHVRGRPTDKAVVCTGDATFSLKSAETSNSLLLVPELLAADEVAVPDGPTVEKRVVVGVHGEYFELRKIKPRFGRLRELLSASPYDGLGDDGGLTFDELLNVAQGSEAEIRRHLNDIEALEVDGRWRLLSVQYHFHALSVLLNLVDESSWSPRAVPVAETRHTLKGLLPTPILGHLCRLYLIETPEFTDEGDPLAELDERRICRFLGESLLRPVDKFNLTDFLAAWESSVPDGLTTDLAQLDGLALHEKASLPPVIWYFPEWRLSEEPATRFAQLFAERPSWTYDQIAPYVTPVATDKQSTNALLTKYARASSVGGQRVYGPRHGR